MNKIIGKKYYRIEFELVSPLALGGGDNQETDKDILINSKGLPYIPGTSVAGVIRSNLDNGIADSYFGKNLVKNEEIDESHYIFYDAVPSKEFEEKAFVGSRDMVGLDEFKVAKKGAKFDMQILEPGIKFVTYIEQNILDDGKQDSVVDAVIEKWIAEGLSFGAKTMRGYGKTKVNKQCIKQAVFDTVANNSDWLDFDIYDADDKNWVEYEPSFFCELKNKAVLSIDLQLKQKGGLSIREYSTKVGKADYSQLKYHRDDLNKIAVIPGTSWAGAFAAQMNSLGLKKESADYNYVFGKVNGTEGSKSHIFFSESNIHDGVDITYSRNAIDRFSGGTIDGALYTESTRYNGTTNLQIVLDDKRAKGIIVPYLAACIMDLATGYMAVGGLTAVGRGMFEVTNVCINGKECCLSYDELKKAMEVE